MQEIIAQGMTYLWGIWRHKWLALAIAWVVALAGWAYVWKMPESYVASAKLYVDTNTVLRPLLQGLAITPDINQRVRMMSSTLFSRPNLEKLARMTDLDLRATTEAQQEALIDRLRDRFRCVGSVATRRCTTSRWRTRSGKRRGVSPSPLSPCSSRAP
jgi:uncharacterized protein involved in exopolysaccharide biosynthesis